MAQKPTQEEPVPAAVGERPDDAAPGEQFNGQGLDPAADSRKAARGEAIEPPAWQHPDYSGPLTGDQALWRTEHLRRK